MGLRFARFAFVAAGAIALGSCGDIPEPAAPARTSGAAAFQPAGGVPDQAQVARWFDASASEVLSLPNTVFADHDEANNRLRFGVERGNSGVAVRNALARLGVPESAYVIEDAEPIVPMATLRDSWRPTVGGIQIHFSQFVCTMGFNADDGADRSFITNSHCTKRQGGVQGTSYFQPASNSDPTVIATEVEDPVYVSGGICPKGKKCRYSDAARAKYGAGTASTRGSIAKTAAPNTGSLTVTGSFSVTAQDNATTSFAMGTTLNKVGRTTGWTQGVVIATCVHTNVQGTNITQLCQTFVQNAGGAVVVGGGDSGSGVFAITSGDNVRLVGILWGGNSNGTNFVFSPLKQIRDELGALVATQ